MMLVSDLERKRCKQAGIPGEQDQEALYGQLTSNLEGGEEAQTIKRETGFKVRRWVVDRAHSWMNRFRRLLVRWDKKPENYLAFLHFACGLIAFPAAGLFG